MAEAILYLEVGVDFLVHVFGEGVDLFEEVGGLYLYTAVTLLVALGDVDLAADELGELGGVVLDEFVEGVDGGLGLAEEA